MILTYQRINTPLCIECRRRPSADLGEGDDKLYCMPCNHDMVTALVKNREAPLLTSLEYNRLPGKRQKTQQASKKTLKRSLRLNSTNYDL